MAETQELPVKQQVAYQHEAMAGSAACSGRRPARLVQDLAKFHLFFFEVAALNFFRDKSEASSLIERQQLYEFFFCDDYVRFLTQRALVPFFLLLFVS